ncbi:MAG: hypothetical protein ACKVP5_17255 [Aestuariivirga sp.]
MAYPSQTVGSAYSGFRHHPATPSGLVSPETWDEPDDTPLFKTRRVGKIRNQPAFFSSFDKWGDSGNDFSDEVLLHYPDLDNDSRNFLKHGPRSAAEKLAYAQEVHPLAHLDAEPASQDIQRKFEEYGDLDRTSYFVGPDGRVYLRNEDSEERSGAKIRRGYENAIGGFATPDIHESLRQISDATRSKRADVELYNPPTLPEQEDRERLLAEYRMNPKAWQSGRRAPEEDQKTFRDAGYVWDAILPFAYAGPDGVLYYKTESTQQDPLSAYNNARDWVETQEYLRTLPEATADELMFRAMAAGGMMPGGRQVRFTNNNSGKFIAPGSIEARSAMDARLNQIPRVVERIRLDGQKSWRRPSESYRASTRNRQQALIRERTDYRAPVPKGRYWGGSKGSKRTQDQIERITQAQEKYQGHIRLHGGIGLDGRSSKELYLPNRAATLLGRLERLRLDGRLGSLRLDKTMYNPYRSDPRWSRYHFRTMTKDPKTGKATLDELNRQLREFLYTGESNFGFLKDD